MKRSTLLIRTAMIFGIIPIWIGATIIGGIIGIFKGMFSGWMWISKYTVDILDEYEGHNH